jgi:DNA-binding MarR family transcriptional regulator
VTDSNPTSAPADPPLFMLLNEIGIIAQLSQNRFEAVQPDGLRMSHFVLLNHLARVGDGTTPLRLARALQLAKSAITNTLQRLEERGLVRVEPDPEDGRGRRVWLTPAGRERRAAGIRTAVEAFALLEGVASPAMLDAIIPPLRALRQELDRAREG